MPLHFLPAAAPLAVVSLLPPRCRLRLRLTLSRAAATSITATPTPASASTFAVEDYLVASCHLTPPQALKASKSLAHLKSASNADAVLAFLAGLGLSPKEVAAVVAYNPRVLCARIDRSLAPISAELRALGLSPSQIAHLAQIAGRYFLCRSFVSKVRFWLPLFGSPERLLQASDWNYWLLTSDLEKVVEPNVAYLKQCGLSAADIAKLLVAAPRLVTMHPEYVQDAVRRATQLGVAPGSQMFRHALSTAGCIGQEKVDAKVAVLKETLGWSQEEVNLAVSKAPRILVASEERLRRNAEFLLNEVGLPPQYIARRSVLLMYSLERRIVPRHLVLKALKEKGLVEQDRCFFNVVAPTEEKFLEKFVAPYEVSIPGLADAYEYACAGKVPEAFQH
ncbi:mTERF transcription factor [Panicum miliaceum]|uniref:mTERF transcription factor n=1 Tax=Panicum miliaceum TaxID=4540 RepID=A0A3L6RQI6_PANMI|nr:mTERF transcription factor [Panicum miliaceum]